MASNLKWSMGFGWATVLSLALGLWLLIDGTGTLRLFGGLIAIVGGVYAVTQYRKWNSTPWRRLHFRGMLLYSRIVGRHSARGQGQQRDFDIVAACRELALAMTGPGKEVNVDAMIQALMQEKGRYLSQLLRPRAPEFFGGAEVSKVESLLKRVEELEFGPDIVMCNIVENTYGEEEAARYAFAICSGDAQ